MVRHNVRRGVVERAIARRRRNAHFDERPQHDYPPDFNVTDVEKYHLSKYFPGRYNPVCTYSPSGQMTSSQSVSGTFGVVNAVLPESSTLIALSNYKYVMLAYCPVLSALAVSDANSTIQNLQSSGLVIFGFNEPLLAALNLNQFFGLDAAGTGGFGDPTTLSLSGLTGVSSSSELDLFKYSGQIDFKIVAPLASLTGAMYRGKLRLGQLFSTTRESTTASAGVPMSRLMRASDEVKTYQSSFSLGSAIVNDYILSKFNKYVNNNTVTNFFTKETFGSEIIDYVIMQTPALSIADASNINYSLISQIRFDLSVMPSPTNLLLYRTFETIAKHKQRNEIDFGFDLPRFNHPPPVNHHELLSFIDSLDDDSEDFMDIFEQDSMGHGSEFLMGSEDDELSSKLCTTKHAAENRLLKQLEGRLIEEGVIKGPLKYSPFVVETIVTSLQIAKDCIETGKMPNRAKRLHEEKKRQEEHYQKKNNQQRPAKKKKVKSLYYKDELGKDWEIYRPGDVNFNITSAQRITELNDVEYGRLLEFLKDKNVPDRFRKSISKKTM